MAEIKSAVELAMEKTKDLHLSREEMNTLKEQKMKSKAQGLVNRFLEVDFHLKEVQKELLKFTPDERKQLEKLMRQYLADAIQLDRDNDLLFQGIETLREESKTLDRQIQQLIKKYRQQKEKAYGETEKNLLAQWVKQGISGSAVQAKVEGSPEWGKALSRFKPAFGEQLRVLQEELKK
jgi:seryl-tRNA synthetase